MHGLDKAASLPKRQPHNGVSPRQAHSQPAPPLRRPRLHRPTPTMPGRPLTTPTLSRPTAAPSSPRTLEPVRIGPAWSAALALSNPRPWRPARAAAGMRTRAARPNGGGCCWLGRSESSELSSNGTPPRRYTSNGTPGPGPGPEL